MKIVEHSLGEFFATSTYEIKGDKIEATYKSLRRDTTWEINISNIQYIRGFKTGPDRWWHLAVILILLLEIVRLVWDIVFQSRLTPYISEPLIVGSLACMVMTCIKKDMVGFWDDRGRCLFSFQSSGKPEVTDFVEQMKEKIKTA